MNSQNTMISRRQFIGGTLGVFFIAPSVAFGASSDEHQAITSDVRNLLEALDSIGQPIQQADKSALTAAISADDPVESILAIPVLFDKYKNYQYAFYTAAVLAVVALLCELVAKRPQAPERSVA